MRELSIEVTPETYEALEVERSLIGFKSRSAYLRWIIDNRAGIDQGTQPEWLVDAYHQRVESLEEPEAAGEASQPEPSRSEPDPESADVAAGTRQSQLDDVTRRSGGTVATSGAPSPRGSGTEPQHSSSAVANTDGGTTVAPDGTEPAEADTRTPPTVRNEDGLELRGTLGKKTIERGSPSTTGSDSSRSEDRDGEGAREDNRERRGRIEPRSIDAKAADIDSVNLTPERIERIREDAIGEDAGLLGSVKVDRLDELSRRAVAKTRKQLNRNVETGLAYVSSTELADETVKPGEDVVDLDELSVPGRSAEVVERRREAVGRAIAYLRDVDAARKSDFVDELYEDVPAGYDTADGWWRCVKAALKQVDAVDGGDGARVWEYSG